MNGSSCTPSSLLFLHSLPQCQILSQVLTDLVSDTGDGCGIIPLPSASEEERGLGLEGSPGRGGGGGSAKSSLAQGTHRAATPLAINLELPHREWLQRLTATGRRQWATECLCGHRTSSSAGPRWWSMGRSRSGPREWGRTAQPDKAAHPNPIPEPPAQQTWAQRPECGWVARAWGWGDGAVSFLPRFQLWALCQEAPRDEGKRELSSGWHPPTRSWRPFHKSYEGRLGWEEIVWACLLHAPEISFWFDQTLSSTSKESVELGCNQVHFLPEAFS